LWVAPMIGRTISHYKITEKLGQGGMGVVYKARDQMLRRDVAVKVLPEGAIADEATRKRFHQEALALGRLNHPNIETVYEFGSEDGIDFVVTEYIPGRTLAKLIGLDQFTEPEIRRLGAQIGFALEEAHQQGVLHCDLKPANILVTPKRQMKLIDFGLAKLAARGESETTLTQTCGERAGGTLAYLAPERLKGKPPTRQSDIYALGIVLYELATGKRPFAEDSPAALIGAILSQVPPTVREVKPGVSEDLEHTIGKCLEKEPEKRYASASELIADLAPSVATGAGQPGGGRPSRKPRRWVRAISTLSLVVALILAYWFIEGSRSLSFTARDWILIADLENQTGDPLFDRSLTDAFTVSLEQSKYANVFPRSRVNQTLPRMGRKAADRIDEQIGRELCVREGIRGLVTLSIAKVGRQYALSARLLNPQTGDTIRSYLERAGNEDRVLDALGTIAGRIRRNLGESLPSIRQSERPLPQVTATSLRALKAYSDGRDLWTKGDYHAAVSQYQEAVKIDPDFAMAHAALGIAYCSHILNNRPQCKEEFRKALDHTDRVTDRERLYLQASAESNVGQFDEAVRFWNQYLNAYPDDSVARYDFGTDLMHNRRTEEAIHNFQEVIRVAPRYAPAYINLATSYCIILKYPEALASYKRAFELEPTWIVNTNLNDEYGFALVKSGDTAGARQVFTLALAKPDMKRFGLRSLALLDLYQGKWRDATARLREAIGLEQADVTPATDQARLGEARDRFHVAAVLGAEGDKSGEVEELDRASRALDQEPVPMPVISALLGMAYSRAGALDKAERILRGIRGQLEPNNSAQSADFHRLEGEVALARGNTDRAIEVISLAERESRLAGGALEVASLAYAYDRAGQSQKAIAEYERLVTMKQDCLGWEAQHFWMAAHSRLAELYAARKEGAKTVQWLDALERLWKDGDADLAPMQRLGRLQKLVAQQGFTGGGHFK